MSKVERILESTDVCLFCGKQLKYEHKYQDHDDMEGYWEYFCTCKDFLKHQEIINKIKELKKQLPEKKFKIQKSEVLYKI